MRLYKSVRLAAVTSTWADDLIAWKQEQLDEQMKNDLLGKAEENLLESYPFLNGISRNISFKVSFSSIVEMCYRNTENYSLEDWKNIAQKMETFQYSSAESSNTPKLYLDDYVWQGLENYQRKLMGEGNKRILRLSYIIKLVLFAGWLEYMEEK
ncbi:hypothetical protein A7X72_01964 [Lactococcus garvieae]|uniref:Uncharacterized protein n=1 Tax=Lactococcus garvieae DCC43 TaxID=1231377 RepID=K2PU79_9LACT|nr:hypothetical protein [Lactococcus garvieae]EKF51016.1 hypothetical protein C426_1597 [Lactococcus garvieae DCC43]OAL07769.1 hypothetical protein A7X72_01964 [Lactococcus garvieae]